LPRIPKEGLAYDGLLCVGPPGSLHLVEGEEGESRYEGEEGNGHQDIDEAKAPPVHKDILREHFGGESYKMRTVRLSK